MEKMRPPPKKRLTEEQKKQNHIDSERKRRETIRKAFDQLSELVPGMEGCARSESVMLEATTTHLKNIIDRKAELREVALTKGWTEEQIDAVYENALENIQAKKQMQMDKAADGIEAGQGGRQSSANSVQGGKAVDNSRPSTSHSMRPSTANSMRPASQGQTRPSSSQSVHPPTSNSMQNYGHVSQPGDSPNAFPFSAGQPAQAGSPISFGPANSDRFAFGRQPDAMLPYGVGHPGVSNSMHRSSLGHFHQVGPTGTTYPTGQTISPNVRSGQTPNMNGNMTSYGSSNTNHTGLGNGDGNGDGSL